VESNVAKMVEKFALVILILFEITFWWVAHNVTKWDIAILDFIKDEFDSILWAVDLSMAVSIAANLLRIFTTKKFIQKASQVIENIFSFVLTWVSFQVFPYDFRKLIEIEGINQVFKILLGLALFGLFVGTMIETGKLLSGEYDEDYIKRSKQKTEE
jgi:hypothetical protein